MIRVLASLLLLSLVEVTYGSPVYDQSNTVAPDTGLTVDVHVPIGQSFTPTLTGLNFVELRMGDLESNGLGGVFNVLIRSGGNTAGPVLGTSQDVTMPDSFGHTLSFGGLPIRFDFLAPVPLVPGNLYAIQLSKVSGDLFTLYGRQTDDYADGTSILFGVAISFQDFYFREGLVVPEPSSFVLAALGLIGLVVLRLRK